MGSFASLQVGLEAYPGCRLVRAIGRGGFSEVWEATRDDGEKLALKFIPAATDLAAAKEIRCIQYLRELQHDHLIAIQKVWCCEGFVVIAMELADGSLLDVLDLSQEEEGTPIPRDEVLGYLLQAADVIDFLNSRRHILNGQRVAFRHCDIKPSNLLLCGDTVKLCDFGLATPTTSVVQAHYRSGTMDFVAPEVFQGRLSNWTDQYALAVSYCQLCTGRLPFHDSPEGFDKTYTRPAPDLSMLPESERPILNRALSPVPHFRWPSCTEMMNRLADSGNAPDLINSRPDIGVCEPQVLDAEMEREQDLERRRH